MGASAVMTTGNAVQVWRGSTQLTSGTTYVAGETLTVKLQSSYSELTFQTSGATFTGSKVGCGSTRSYATTASLKIPVTSTAGATVSVFAGYTSREGAVSITNSFMLVGGAPTPTYLPTKAPTAARTVVVFPVQAQFTNIAAAVFNAGSGTTILATVIQQALTSSLQSDVGAVAVKVTGPATVSASSSIVSSNLQLQATSSCLVSVDISVTKEFTAYATTDALSAAVSTGLQSSASVLTALKRDDAATFGGATALSLTTTAVPVVNTLQTAAPTSSPIAVVASVDGVSSEINASADKVRL